jgi:hypothetical protein
MSLTANKRASVVPTIPVPTMAYVMLISISTAFEACAQWRNAGEASFDD